MASKINNTIINYKKCDVCNKKIDDPILFGDKITKFNITVHYYCLLLSTNLPQRGKDCGGILGFLKQDIEKEIIASKERTCIYCGETSASIKCDYKLCQKYFHLTCGIANFTQHEFVDQFKSYCHKHITIIVDNKHNVNATCRICCKNMNSFNVIHSIKANCCGYGWIHSLCLKQYALSSGYYLKCFWCRSIEFREQVKYQGIFVPDRDAAWEIEKSNFTGLYQNYSNCDAKDCKCPHGRQNTKNKKQHRNWKLLICNVCGASGVHKFCSGKNDDYYTCSSCIEVFNRTILTKNINTYRLRVDDHLQVTLFHNNDQEDLNQTLYIQKFNQNNDSNHQVKLFKYDIRTNQVAAVIHGMVEEPNKNEYKHDEIEIIREVNVNTSFNKEEFKQKILDWYQAILEEDKKQNLLNNGEHINIESSDEDATAMDLLDELINKSTELKVPKPIPNRKI